MLPAPADTTRDELDGLELESLPRHFVRTLIDSVLPLASLWLWWQLQDETSRLRLALGDAGDQLREARSRLADIRRQRILDAFRRDLDDVPTMEREDEL